MRVARGIRSTKRTSSSLTTNGLVLGANGGRKPDLQHQPEQWGSRSGTTEDVAPIVENLHPFIHNGKMLRTAEQQQSVERSLVRANATPTVTSTGKVMYRDEENEEARKYRRTVYDFQAWAHHRSVERYRLHLLSMPKSRNLKSLWTPVVAVGVISFLFCAYEQALADGLLPASLPDLAQPALPLQLTSFALALLLVFRTNSAYGRWWEARKIWGGLLNRSRDIMRQALTFFQPTNVAGKEAFGRWMCAYTVALEAHLRDPRDATVDPTQIAVLTPEEQQLLNTAAHKPNMCLQVLSQLVDSEPGVDMCRAAEVHQNLTFFHDVTGKCERILRTPIPLSYTRHTTRFLMIWLALLPIGLWNSLHWATVPGDLLIAFLLLGIDEIAIQIEEPFGILPLEALCDRVQIDVQALLKQDDSVREYATMANSASNGGRPLPKNIGLGNGNGGRMYSSGHIPAAVDQPWVSSQGAAAANADQN